MKQIDNILNELLAKLLETGLVEFSEDGVNIKAEYNNGNFTFKADFIAPEGDGKELLNRFEEYVKSLSDEFFLEATESFEKDELMQIQNKLDSCKESLVREGIDEFMDRLKDIAKNKIDNISDDIEELEKELSDLIELRDSYEHVLNKEF